MGAPYPFGAHKLVHANGRSRKERAHQSDPGLESGQRRYELGFLNRPMKRRCGTGLHLIRLVWKGVGRSNLLHGG